MELNNCAIPMAITGVHVVSSVIAALQSAAGAAAGAFVSNLKNNTNFNHL
jgi:hypothetical protein